MGLGGAGPSCSPREGEELWGKIVSVRSAYGFLQLIGDVADKGDIFFRAADVVGMSSDCNDVGEANGGLQIVLPSGRNSNGHRSFYLMPDDEVSFSMSQDPTGKPCGINIRKERKGAWRSTREESSRGNRGSQVEPFKAQVKRLL